jgi:phage terminase large subunit
MAAKTGFQDGLRPVGPHLTQEERDRLVSLVRKVEPFPEEEQVRQRIRRMIEPELPVWTQWLDVTPTTTASPVRHRVAFGGRGASKTRSFATKLLLRGLSPRSSASFAPANFSDPSATRSIASWSMKSTGWAWASWVRPLHRHGTRNPRRQRDAVHLRRPASQRKRHQVAGRRDHCLGRRGADRQPDQHRRADADRPRREFGNLVELQPALPDDPVDAMFRPKDGRPPPGTVLIPVNYFDNPYFPAVLRREMEYDRGRDPDKYQHKWRGAYLQRSEAKVFKQLEGPALRSS